MDNIKFRQIVREMSDSEWLARIYWDEAEREVSHWDKRKFAIVAGELTKRGIFRTKKQMENTNGTRN